MAGGDALKRCRRQLHGNGGAGYHLFSLVLSFLSLPAMVSWTVAPRNGVDAPAVAAKKWAVAPLSPARTALGVLWTRIKDTAGP